MPNVVVKQKQIKPQDGFQMNFLSSRADITIGGGMAGVGKSWCLQVAPLRHADIRGFNCITFRRTLEQIKNPGSLWDKSMELYPMFGFKQNEQQKTWTKRHLGITLKFSHLQFEKNIYDHDGTEYALICWDELQHFTRKMFFYLLSRNRSTCGIRPYILASCNPDPNSFLAEFLAWWIDQEEIFMEDTWVEGRLFRSGTKNPNWGFPIKERIGKLRYMIVHEDNVLWGNSKAEVIQNYPYAFEDLRGNMDDHIKSVTFITGSIYENKALLDTNPSYLSNLNALDEIEKLRLLYGNWKISANDVSLHKQEALLNMFSNTYPNLDRTSYITCDAARFGDDLATIFTWIGMMCVRLDIFTKSSQIELIKEIEKRRKEFGTARTNVLVDQDGVGGYVVKTGKYIGFSSDGTPIIERGTKSTDGNDTKESYENLKTQLAYHWADKLNSGEVIFQLDEGSIYVDGYHGTKIKLKDTTWDVRDLIKADYRAIRRMDVDEEGKKQINSKLDQKKILKGRSPDFYDGSMLRGYFLLKKSGVVVGTASQPTQKVVKGGSILDMLRN